MSTQSRHAAAYCTPRRVSVASAPVCAVTDQRDDHLVIVIEQELIRDHRGIASLNLVVHTLTGLDLREIPEGEQGGGERRGQRSGAADKQASESEKQDSNESTLRPTHLPILLFSAALCCASDHVMMNGPVDVEMNVSFPSPTLKCAGVKLSDLIL